LFVDTPGRVANQAGISQTISRVWRVFYLQPHSFDPAFVDKSPPWT
jgi:hypothetical protein